MPADLYQMSSRIAERRFGARQFRVEPMLATRAISMQARLFRLAGPAIEHLGEILKGVGKDKTDEERNTANTATIQAFVSIFENTDPDQLAYMVKEITELAEIKRPSGSWEKVDFDGDFTGQQGDIIPLVVWVCQEQFGDFFSGLPGIGNLRNPDRG